MIFKFTEVLTSTVNEDMRLDYNSNATNNVKLNNVGVKKNNIFETLFNKYSNILPELANFFKIYLITTFIMVMVFIVIVVIILLEKTYKENNYKLTQGNIKRFYELFELGLHFTLFLTFWKKY